MIRERKPLRMNYKFTGALILVSICCLAISCAKINASPDGYPEPARFNEYQPVYDTINISISQWMLQTDEVYRSVFTFPNNQRYAQIFVQDSGKYENHSGVSVAYYYTDITSLPFDSLMVSVIVLQ